MQIGSLLIHPLESTVNLMRQIIVAWIGNWTDTFAEWAAREMFVALTSGVMDRQSEKGQPHWDGLTILLTAAVVTDWLNYFIKCIGGRFPSANSAFHTPVRQHIMIKSKPKHKTCYSFFPKLLHLTSCLHHLLPPKRHNHQMAKLRRTLSYDIPFARTNKFKNSFLLYALHNYV